MESLIHEKEFTGPLGCMAHLMLAFTGCKDFLSIAIETTEKAEKAHCTNILDLNLQKSEFFYSFG